MAKITGTNGAVKSGALVVGSVTEFSVERTGETVEDSVLGQTEKSFVPDRTSWAGSMTVLYDPADTGQDTLTINAELELHLIPGGDTAGNEDFNGSVILTGVSLPVAAGAMVSKNVSFQGTGVLAEDVLV